MSETLARIDVQNLKEYQSARSLVTDGKIFLDANESPLSPLESSIHRYPEPQPKKLVERLSSIYDVPGTKMMIGRGSDEAIDVIVRVFCEANKDKILICPPTYGMYEVSAKTQGAGVVLVPMILDGEKTRLDEEAILKQTEERGTGIKIIFLCSPNNPTGTVLPKETLIRICKASKNKAIVVVDEAYAEFSKRESMIQCIGDFPNLIVLRTLSKAWASAGIRIGVALAQEPIIKLLQKVRAPYPLSLPAVEAALLVTTPEKHNEMQNRVALIVREREAMVNALKDFAGIELIYPSSTNFLLIQFKRHAETLANARTKGIILRDRSSEKGLENCIRITVGTPGENKAILSLIQEVLS